jgi:chemotaxis protein MotB
MLRLLSQRYGLPESRLSIASYGTYRPADPNDTPDGRAHNRRVELVIAQ